MNACAACGAELSADDALCGSCGQPVEACAAVEPTDTGGSASAGAPPVASSGDYVPGDAPKHGFRLTPEPDRIAASASAVIEQAIVAAGIETDPAWLRHCQINWSSSCRSSRPLQRRETSHSSSRASSRVRRPDDQPHALRPGSTATTIPKRRTTPYAGAAGQTFRSRSSGCRPTLRRLPGRAGA